MTFSRETMRQIAGHLYYASAMHNAQCGHWTRMHNGEPDKSGPKARAFMKLAMEASALANEAKELAITMERASG